MVTVRITTDGSKTDTHFTNKVEAYRYALHMVEAGYQNVEIREGV